MRAPYRFRRDLRYPIARAVCRVRGHRTTPTGTHWWCTRCGDARGTIEEFRRGA